MFIIEDEVHAEPQKEHYNSYDEAFNYLKRLSTISWNEAPNKCPCTNWEDCSRQYVIIEYDDSSTPWKEINRTQMILEISSKGVEWV